MPGGCVPSPSEFFTIFTIHIHILHLLSIKIGFSVVGNIAPYVAGEENPTVPTPYSAEIMEEAKTNPELRGIELN